MPNAASAAFRSLILALKSPLQTSINYMYGHYQGHTSNDIALERRSHRFELLRTEIYDTPNGFEPKWLRMSFICATDMSVDAE